VGGRVPRTDEEAGETGTAHAPTRMARRARPARRREAGALSSSPPAWIFLLLLLSTDAVLLFSSDTHSSVPFVRHSRGQQAGHGLLRGRDLDLGSGGALDCCAGRDGLSSNNYKIGAPASFSRVLDTCAHPSNDALFGTEGVQRTRAV
jgi:hypothetical protein